MSRPRHAARVGWLWRPRGNPGQAPGRHTPEYLASVEHGVGMYPLGQARRQTPDNNTHADDDREVSNDPGRIFR